MAVTDQYHVPCAIFRSLIEVELIVLKTSGGLFIESDTLYCGQPAEPQVWPDVVLAHERFTVGKMVGDRALEGVNRSKAGGAVGTQIQNLKLMRCTR